MPELRYISPEGLALALDMLKELCLTASQGESIYNALEVLADAVVFPASAISIPTTGWVEAAGEDFPYSIDVAAEISEYDSADVVLDINGQNEAQACGLCPTVWTFDGHLQFKSKTIPSVAINGEYRILRGPIGG